MLEFLRANAELIIALCALALSIHQGILGRRHERLSVRPFLAIDRRFLLEQDLVELVLCNHGPGVAYIKSFMISLDGKPLSQVPQLWHDVGKQLSLPLMQGGGTLYSSADAIPPHSTVAIASFRSPSQALAAAGPEVVEQLSRIGIYVKYASAFNESFELKSGA